MAALAGERCASSDQSGSFMHTDQPQAVILKSCLNIEALPVVGYTELHVICVEGETHFNLGGF